MGSESIQYKHREAVHIGMYSKYNELVAFGKGEKLALFYRTVELNEGG